MSVRFAASSLTLAGGQDKLVTHFAGGPIRLATYSGTLVRFVPSCDRAVQTVTARIAPLRQSRAHARRR